MKRSGILMHISSLPSNGGIGTLGRSAYDFVNFLVASGMSVWQVLPLSPTGFGDSPYQSMSTYAGNPLLIDMQMLVDEGILTAHSPESRDGEKVDYGQVIPLKTAMLKAAYSQSYARLAQQVYNFREKHAWIEDYALFAALKGYFGNGSWYSWPDNNIRMRTQDAMVYYRQKLKDQVDYHVFVQYLFFTQWHKLKKYANNRGISLFGDMPIYVAEDSADVWSNPNVFQLDTNRRPIKVAGVPPDYFSADGQLWGNPLYDWDFLYRTKYRWWVERLACAGETFDMIRIDHFIGFANYYAIAAGSHTAREGAWLKGPGRLLFRIIRRKLPNMRIVAEDLGAVNNRVKRLLDYCGYPGMKVLSFAFDGDPGNPHLPAHYNSNCVAYTGTHDNDTTAGWFANISGDTKARVRHILNMQPEDDICDAMIATVISSAADIAIIPMQDILSLPGYARMNMPGAKDGNWQWRMKRGMLTGNLSARLYALNTLYGRTSGNKVKISPCADECPVI
jgi:4-alpha-glucanotransferase